MLVFPNAKINLGLHIVSKRSDGFHNIETVFYPVSWCDALEVIENTESSLEFEFSQSGLTIEGKAENNLLYKTWQAVREIKALPAIKVHLHKTIPMGAGLGGGSSDAAYFIKALNDKFELHLTPEQSLKIASVIGSDCAFFLTNRAAFACGKGDELRAVEINLNRYYILLVYPGIHSNTAQAYAGITPQSSPYNLSEHLTKRPVKEWKDFLKNDFEAGLFQRHPELSDIKAKLYKQGALYAGMSGSGSCLFGIFETEPVIQWPEGYQFYLQKPLINIL